MNIRSSIILTSLLSLLSSQNLSAQNLDCPPKFQMDMTPWLERAIKADLGALGNLRGTSASLLFRQFFGTAFDGDRLLHFFCENIHEVAEPDYISPTIGAYVNERGEPHRVYIGSIYLPRLNVPRIVRLGVLLHEAGHAIGADRQGNRHWLHTRCPVPYLNESGVDIRGPVSGTKFEGKNFCDNDKISSNGLQYVFLKNVERFCSNCDEETKVQAHDYAEHMLDYFPDPQTRRELQYDSELRVE